MDNFQGILVLFCPFLFILFIFYLTAQVPSSLLTKIKTFYLIKIKLK